MTKHLLWTDQCFLFVLLVSVILIIRSFRKEPVRRAFFSIFMKPIPACSAIILLVFLMISVLDSIHIKSISSTGTVLDGILSPLDTEFEKTYSAPLSLTLFATETVLNQGRMEQVFPRLSYPSSRISNDTDRLFFIQSVLMSAVLMAVLVTGMVWLAVRLIKRFVFGLKHWSIGITELCVLLTLGVVLVFAFGSYGLSRELHILGTGKIGQDIFYYAVKSIRTGLVIGILTTLFMMPLALLLGIAAGYFGGVVDDIIQYIYTTLSSIPGVLLITASVLSMQTYIANHPQQFKTLAENADARLLALCLILGVTSWTSLCRLLRAESMKLREVDFVLAAKALGSGSFKIIYKHLLPNVMHIVVITLVLDFSFLVLAEAVLSYVGVGVSPMTISWGNMINAARLELAREPVVWWPVLSAFLFMFLLVLASNLFADAVCEAFDPHQVK